MESEITTREESGRSYFIPALVAGGAAGLCVDLSLFPLDTVKTRLQSERGFWKSGGFKGIYSGLASAAVGSAPTAALFFLTYETVKHIGRSQSNTNFSHVVIMAAASLGEVSACLVRVPVEVVKQRAQVDRSLSSRHVFQTTLKSEGIRGLYRGYFTTCIREVPFSFIQFPVWEQLKKSLSAYQGKEVEAWQSSICGAMSGCFAAGITTPVDVAKTRIMLAKKDSVLAEGKMTTAMTVIYKERGIKGLFSGILPRMLWISIGGAIFLGVYDKVRSLVCNRLHENSAD